jgi:hypothetical protein
MPQGVRVTELLAPKMVRQDEERGRLPHGAREVEKSPAGQCRAQAAEVCLQATHQN